MESCLTSHKGVISLGRYCQDQAWRRQRSLKVHPCHFRSATSRHPILSRLPASCIPGWCYHLQFVYCPWSLSKAGQQDREFNMEARMSTLDYYTQRV